jgi:hypothetical protein
MAVVCLCVTACATPPPQQPGSISTEIGAAQANPADATQDAGTGPPVSPGPAATPDKPNHSTWWNPFSKSCDADCKWTWATTTAVVVGIGIAFATRDRSPSCAVYPPQCPTGVAICLVPPPPAGCTYRDN